MACLDESRAIAFVGGDLDAPMRMLVEDHIDDCDQCRRVLAALVQGSRPNRMAEPTDWGNGTRIGRYVVLARIGRGAMGTVFRAEDVELGRPVALKRLHAGADAESRARLLREARSAAQLQHPNAVTVHEVGEHDGTPFLAMELVDGVTLRAWLRERTRSWREIVTVVAQAGRGLAAAHARGLVHRDFKPDNVLVDRQGRARVADFGLARAGDATVHDSDPAPAVADRLARITASGSLAGTPAYMAPEIVEGAAPDPKSDQYAFAITLFEALRGKLPFAGDTAASIWVEMAAGRIQAGGRSVPAWLDKHVRRGLDVDPAKRWPDVASFVAAIEKPPRRAWWIGGIAVAAITAATIALAVRAPAATAPSCDALATEYKRSMPLSALHDGARRAPAVSPERKVADHLVASVGRYVDELSATHRAACAATFVRREQSAEMFDRQMICLGSRAADVRAVVSVAQSGQFLEPLQSAVAALEPANECLRTAELVQMPAPPRDVHTQGEIRGIQDGLAETRTWVVKDEHARALTSVSAAVERARRLGYLPLLARALIDEAHVLRRLSRFNDARVVVGEAREVAARAHDDYRVVAALLLLASIAGVDQDQVAEGSALVEAARAWVTRTNGSSYMQARVHHAAAEQARSAKHPADVLAHVKAGREALKKVAGPLEGTDQLSELALSLTSLSASALFDLGRYDEAEVALREELAMKRSMLGETHSAVARTYNNIAVVQMKQAKLPDARESLHHSQQLLEPKQQPERELLAQTYSVQGHVERGLANHQASLQAYRRALEIEEAIYGTSHRRVWSTRNNVANALGSLQKWDQALELYRAYYDWAVTQYGAVSSEGRAATVNLANALLETGAPADALAHAHALQAQSSSKLFIGQVNVLALEAKALAALKRPAEAAEVFGRALALGHTTSTSKRLLAYLERAQAESLWDAGQRARALRTAEHALVAYRALPGDTADADALAAWIRERKRR